MRGGGGGGGRLQGLCYIHIICGGNDLIFSFHVSKNDSFLVVHISVLIMDCGGFQKCQDLFVFKSVVPVFG